mmetsp:Transcript_31762/g.38373  ORF Transcript_31762/g.38373 Transcript_31762/m.38373 type:complete len:589 (-) Transcript_31762:154-1920(-)
MQALCLPSIPGTAHATPGRQWNRNALAPKHSRRTTNCKPTQCRPRVYLKVTSDTSIPVNPQGVSKDRSHTTDYVVIGSGVGGLSCAGLLARYGYQVTVCESHSLPGGAAHAFEREGYIFDSGPSFYSGISSFPSVNPLGQVLDALDKPLKCETYNRWICHLPEGTFTCVAGAEDYRRELERVGGAATAREWERVEEFMAPLSEAAASLPAAALRADPLLITTLPAFLPSLLKSGPRAALLQAPFKTLLDMVGVKDDFLRRMMDLECFVLSGVPANGTISAEMTFMFGERNRPGSTIDYPIGGSGAVVGALVDGLEENGGKLLVNAHVEQVLVGANGRAEGVQLRSSKGGGGGAVINATRGVISNASVWDTERLLPSGALPQVYKQEVEDTPECGSFLHLHLGIDASDLPEDLDCHHVVVNDWSLGVDAPRNVIVISIPTVFDADMAPPGKHVVHAYTAGSEPWSEWVGMDRTSKEYKDKKAEAVECLWVALERVIPDIRSRAEVTLEGTPLTHQRFLRRHHGTYGPAIEAGKGTFPGPGTPIPGLYRCGDSTQPGIGLPAVAASGMIAANTLAPVWKHWELLSKIKAW